MWNERLALDVGCGARRSGVQILHADDDHSIETRGVCCRSTLFGATHLHDKITQNRTCHERPAKPGM